MIAKGMGLCSRATRRRLSATGGTLKPTHAVTMHAILVLPLLAWLVSFANLDRATAAALVLLGVAAIVRARGGRRVENVMGAHPALSALGGARVWSPGAAAALASTV